jgi:hypothetical protein
MPIQGSQYCSPLVDMILSVKIWREVAALPHSYTMVFTSIHAVKQQQGESDDMAFQ